MKTPVVRLVVHGLILLFSPPLFAQETAALRHQMATNQLKQIAAEVSARCLKDVSLRGDWDERRPRLRQQLLEMLGLDPLPERTPLQSRITGALQRNGYRIEKIVFQSSPGLYVTGDFYVPVAPGGRLPTILYLCGHSPNLLGAKVEYQDRAIWFASHGYTCLVLDTLEFGEVPGIHHGTHNLNMWNWLSLGYTPAGVEVWNAIRALDYLGTRPEVDPKRIGLTGISGGGAMTWYTAALDDRIAVAAPVCSAFTFGSQAAHWIADGQCDCIYFNNTYRWDFPMVAGLIAPRPLLIIGGRRDPIFPPDGYHEVFQRAKRVYDLYAGGAERIGELEDDVGHSDPPLFLQGARQWMERWLKTEPIQVPLETNSPPREKDVDLACLTQLPADAVNYRIQNQFTRVVRMTTPGSPAEWERHRAELLAQLREKVFRWFPTQAIPFDTKLFRTNSGYMTRYARYQEVSFQTEPGVRIRGQLLTPMDGDRKAPLLIYVKRAGDSIYFMDTDELLPLMGRYAVLILNPRFIETAIDATEYANIERTAVWVGRTIAAMQVWDVLRTLNWVSSESKLAPSSISLYGKGDMGVLAVYAALFDGRISTVVANDPPSSHWHSPALLNVLRVTDIPEVVAALAPRRFVSIAPQPESFDFAKGVYSLLGVSSNLVRAGSLPEGLEVWKHSDR
jgi:cephalosporin-C deacetylase-like acetyl esterase